MIYLLDTSAVPDRIPTVDSLIAASAQQRGACLVHRDGHFRAIPVALLQTIDLKPSDKNPRAPVDRSVAR
jgi:predicted nucleic acid-binding protein